MAKPVAGDGFAVAASRVSKLIHRELSPATASLTNHREALQFSRIRVYGPRPLLSSLGGDLLSSLLLLVELSHI